MRTILLAFIIAASGVAKNFQTIHIDNTRIHKIKKGETAAQIAKKNGITILELRHLNPNVNLSHLSIGTAILTNKSKPSESHLQPTLHENIKNPAVLHKHSAMSLTMPLPRIPVAERGSLMHLEHVLLVELAPPSILLTKHADAAITTRSSPSRYSALTNTRKMITNKKNEESDERVSSTLMMPYSDKLNATNHGKLDLFWPVETRTISSTWGPRVRTKLVKVRVSRRSKRHKHVLKQFVGNHKGVDLSAPQGGDVFAAMDGQITTSCNHRHYGNFITIDHGNGVMTLYGHCDKNFVLAGETVRRGQKIAEVGRTGNATGPHVHFELRLDGTARNPLPFMKNTEGTTSVMAKNKSYASIASSQY